MNSFDIYFTRPWVLLALIPALLLAIIPFLRLSPIRRKSLNKKISLVMHCVIVTAAVLLLSGLTFYRSTDNTHIIVVADVSDSTQETQTQMAAYLKDIVEQADSDTQVGIVLFANGSVYASEVGKDPDTIYSQYLSCSDQPDGSATNIEDAINYAAGLFSDDANKRIVLLSDGAETDGDAESAAEQLADQDIRIDAMYFASEQEDQEVQLTSVEAPEKTDAGTEVTISVGIDSNIATQGVLQIYDNNTLISEEDVSITSGSNSYSSTYVVQNSGIHAIYATIDADNDTLTENNGKYAYISASGAGNILIVDGTGNEADALTQILDEEYNVTVTTSSGVAQYANQLQMYEEVILMNVSNADLPEGFDETLQNYTENLGGGLLTIGGDNTYAYGEMEDTAFEDMLPVDLESDDVQTVALILVIDSSSSMNGTNLSMAKQGAQNSVNALNDTDYVGVITFATNMTVVSKLTSVTNKASVLSGINNISTSRGTNMYNAVYEAYNELKDFDADIKHVIILSDGNPTDSGSDKVIKLMANAGISTSTICLGSSANTTLMQTYAQYGNGRYYNVTQASDLPDIMLSETMESQVTYLNEVTFTPVINSYTTELNGVSSLPQLDGYITTTAKSDATLVLSTDDDNHAPLYAKWTYGNGHVGSFTSDLSGEWSEDFLNSTDGVTFIKNMVAGLLPTDTSVSGLYVTVTENNYSADVEIASDVSDGDSIEVSVVAPSGAQQTVVAQKQASGNYLAQIDTEEEGVYSVVVMKYSSDGNLTDYTQQYVASSYSEEYDQFPENSSSGKELLLNICRAADGELASSVKELFDIGENYVEYEHNPYKVLVISILVLFLADVAVRKFKIRKKKTTNGEQKQM